MAGTEAVRVDLAGIHIAAPGCEPAELPLDVLVNSAAIMAVKGAGKTYTGSVAAEELLERGVPIVVLDPTGAWWGLQSSADGTGPGYHIVIFGGEHGDLPLEPTSGAVVADAIVEHNLSAILDLSQFQSLGEQRRFVIDFAERFHHAKSPEARHTPHALIIDEADEFCPQGAVGEDLRMVGAIARIIKRDRIRGIWTILISQRCADVNKKALSQCHLLIALQTVAKRDRDAIEDWVEIQGGEGARAEMMAGIAGLQVGQAWLCEPRLGLFALTQIRPRRTFDSSATPRPGEVRIEPTARAEVDLGALRAAIAATVSAEATDTPGGRMSADARNALAERDRRIADLERQLRERTAPDPVVQTVEVPALSDSDRAVLRDFTERIGELAEPFRHTALLVRDALRRVDPHPSVERIDGRGDLAGQASRIRSDLVAFNVPPGEAPPAGRAISPAPKPAAPPRAAQNGAQPLTRPQGLLLDALAWWEAVGVDVVDRRQLAFVAGFALNGGHFRNRLSELRALGLIVDHGGHRVGLTESGRARAGAPVAPATRQALHEMVMERLTGTQRRLLAPLLAAYPQPLTRDALAETAGFEATGGHFRNRLSELRSAGLVEEPSRNTVGAHPMLFAVPSRARGRRR